jgi:hypothetical protein
MWVTNICGLLSRSVKFSPGVDVMITIFCDFRQFWAKMAFFSKNQFYDQNFAQCRFMLSQKRQFFRQFF